MVAPAPLDEAFRRVPRTAESVEANGDPTPFVSVDGKLRHGGGWVPVVLVASEMAIHVIDPDSGNSGVSSYNRVVRFDRLGSTVGLCAYVGQRPVAEMIGLGMGFAASELVFYVIDLPSGGRADAVLERAQSGFDLKGVPADAHMVKPFLY